MWQHEWTAILYALHAKYVIEVKYCNLIGTETIAAAHTSSVLQRAPPSNQKSKRVKGSAMPDQI